MKIPSQREVDEIRTYLIDSMPPLLNCFYEALIKEGRTEYQALELTKMYMLTSFALNISIYPLPPRTQDDD